MILYYILLSLKIYEAEREHPTEFAGTDMRMYRRRMRRMKRRLQI
jgi:hypothetical protein